VFESETIHVPYDHTQLIIGTVYPQYYVIGAGLQIFYGNTDARWWRQINWHGGISLDPIISTTKGLHLLDEDTYAFAAGKDPGSVNGSRTHARLDLRNLDWEKEKSYWDNVSRAETNAQFYLNTVIGLQDEVDSGDPGIMDTFSKLIVENDLANELNAEMGWPQEKPDYEILPRKLRVNALDVFFQSVLADVAVVICIDPERIGDPEGLYNFLRAEMTPGATPVIIAFAPVIAGDILDNGDGTSADDGAVFYPFDYLLVTEPGVTDTMIEDSATFSPETSWLNIN
jgi:hypothetical protein